MSEALLVASAVGLLGAAVLFHTLAHSPAAPRISRAFKDIIMSVSAQTQTAIAAFEAKQAANTDAAKIAELQAAIVTLTSDLADNEMAWEQATGTVPPPVPVVVDDAAAAEAPTV